MPPTYHPAKLRSLPVRSSQVHARYAVPAGDSSGLFGLLRTVALWTVPWFVVTGAIYQAEMLVASGRAPLSPAFLKIGMLALFLAAFFLRLGTIRSNRPVFAAGMIFFGFLLLDALHLYFDLGMQVSDIVLGYNAYYALAFLAVLSCLVPLRIPDKQIVKILSVLAVGSIGLGLAQFITNAPIVPTVSTDNNFAVNSWSGGGPIRVFSLFDEPQTCALFFVFFSALLVAFCRRPKYRLIALPLLLISLFMCWIADARAQLAGILWALIAAAVITFWNRPNRTRYLPLLAMLSALPVAMFAYSRITGGSGTNTVTDASSFAIRLTEWSYYLKVLRSLPISNLLFGLGIVQNGKLLSINAPVYIDNLYLTVAMHIGLVGLILYLFLAWRLWEDVRRNAESRNSYLHSAVAATFSTFLLMGFFNNVPLILGAYFMLYAISDARQSPGAETDAEGYPRTNRFGLH